MKQNTLLLMLIFSDENAGKSSIKLQFLKPGVRHRATLYEDAPDAHWKQDPKAYQIRTIEVTSKISLPHKLTVGGGAAINIISIQK